MKRFLLFLGFLLVFAFFVVPSSIYTAKADTVEEQLEAETNSQIDSVDFSQIQSVVDSSDTSFVAELGPGNFKTLVENIVDGKFVLSFGTIFKSIVSAVGSSFSKNLPFVGLLLVVVLLSSIFGKLRPTVAQGEVENIIFFATYGVCVLVVSKVAFDVLSSTTNSLLGIQKQMQATFPVLLTLMTAAGGTSSVKIYQPTLGLLSNGVCTIFVAVLLPLFSVVFVLDVISNLSDNVKVEKFKSLVSSVFKWILGLVSTIFMAYLAVQGMTAATVDGVSIRTAKYAIKNYVPVIGGYISDGFEVVMASSMLLKNGIGLAALVVLLSSVLAPILGILILSLSLKLVAALSEPVADKKFSTFLFGVSKSLNMLTVILVGAALMYFLSIALMIGTANTIV